MSQALPGQHYCLTHQGNHSHYDTTNCTVCIMQSALHDIAGGHIPPGFSLEKEGFLERIWVWSQKIAKAALERTAKL